MAGEVAATGNLSTDAAHTAHWEAFWQRSFIDIATTEASGSGGLISQQYALTR